MENQPSHLVRVIGQATLILGDCNEIMCSPLHYCSRAQHCITDPPYESHMHKQRRAGIRRDGGKETPAPAFDSIEAMRPFVAANVARLVPGWFLAFCTAEGVAPWRDAIEAAGMKYKRAMPWVKTDAAPQFNGQGPAHCLEMIVAAWSGPGFSRWNGGGLQGEFRGPAKHGRTGMHETEKPGWLMARIIELFTRRGETILDPFMGCGTTGVEALRQGRRFIGIEQDGRYYQAAVERISEIAQRPDMFSDFAPVKPIQFDLLA